MPVCVWPIIIVVGIPVLLVVYVLVRKWQLTRPHYVMSEKLFFRRLEIERLERVQTGEAEDVWRRTPEERARHLDGLKREEAKLQSMLAQYERGDKAGALRRYWQERQEEEEAARDFWEDFARRQDPK